MEVKNKMGSNLSSRLDRKKAFYFVDLSVDRIDEQPSA